MLDKKWRIAIVMLVVGSTLVAACAGPTPAPEVVRVTVEVTRIVVGTPETVIEEIVVTATPPPEPTPCSPALGSPPMLKPGKLIMATNAVSPPYQWIDAEGKLQGERIDLGEEIASRLCLEPEWVNVQWEAIIAGLQGGRWDFINSGTNFTEERTEFLEMVPYEAANTALSVALGNPLNIESAEDLAGLRVATECPGFEFEAIKSLSEELVEAGKEAIDIRCFATSLDSLAALNAGQSDAEWSAGVVAKWYEDKGLFGRVVFDQVGGQGKTFAFVNTELAQAVADVLNEMLADGTYDAILDKWGGGKIQLWSGWTGKFEVY